jgi:RNA polymerase sigma-B factor
MPDASETRTPDARASDDAWVAAALERYAQRRDDEVLRDEIFRRARWLALRGARRFSDRGEPFDDLVQVASIGLLKAIERFEPSMGVPFGSYATPTILGELRRHFRDHTWSVRVPRRAKDLRSSVTVATDELHRLLGRSPTVAEIAARLAITEDAVLEVMEANNAYRARPLEHVSVVHRITVDDDADQVLDREMVIGLLDCLRPRERTILYLRFFEELSQAQIAERVGTSQVHVGRLIASSLQQLRSHLHDEHDEHDVHERDADGTSDTRDARAGTAGAHGQPRLPPPAGGYRRSSPGTGPTDPAHVPDATT